LFATATNDPHNLKSESNQKKFGYSNTTQTGSESGSTLWEGGKMNLKTLSRRLVIAFFAALMVVPVSAPAQASFTYSEQGQVISPYAIWLPASADAPEQGSQISISYDVSGYNGTASPPTQPSFMPTVSYVIADFG
jgi:hypothetical protein